MAPSVFRLLSTFSLPILTTLPSSLPEMPLVPNTNTKRLRDTIARFPNAKATVQALDLSSLMAIHAFADQITSEISKGKYILLAAIIANAYY
jgi:hypothetical protein